MIEVKDGIDASDIVVYEGINKIKNGVEVKIQWIFQSFLSKNQFFV